MCLMNEHGTGPAQKRSPAREDYTVSMRELDDFAALLRLIDKSLDRAIRAAVRRLLGRTQRPLQQLEREKESKEGAKGLSDAMLELVI